MSNALKSLRNHLPSRVFEREIAPGVRVNVKRRIMPFIPTPTGVWDSVRGRVADAWHIVRPKADPKYRLR